MKDKVFEGFFKLANSQNHVYPKAWRNQKTLLECDWHSSKAIRGYSILLRLCHIEMFSIQQDA